MAHRCYIDGCTRNVPDTILLCKPHWYRVPAPLRAQVWKTWKALTAADGGLWAVKEYRRAKQAAIDAVNERLQKSV